MGKSRVVHVIMTALPYLQKLLSQKNMVGSVERKHQWFAKIEMAPLWFFKVLSANSLGITPIRLSWWSHLTTERSATWRLISLYNSPSGTIWEKWKTHFPKSLNTFTSNSQHLWSLCLCKATPRLPDHALPTNWKNQKDPFRTVLGQWLTTWGI